MPDTHRLALPKRAYLACILAGLLQALSFAPGPLPVWILPFSHIISISILFNYIWQNKNLKQTAILAWLFAFALFSLGIYWLVISMHEYGGMALPLAIGALFIFAAAMAIYYAMAATLAQFLCINHIPPEHTSRRLMLNASIWASAWVLAEWLRGTLFTGFTWLTSGYAHAEGMFTAWAPIFGVYGLSWLAVFSAAAITIMAKAKDSKYDKNAAIIIGIAIGFGLLGMAFKHIAWYSPHGEPVLARLVQTNTPQENKFAFNQMWQNQNDALKLASLAAKEQTPDLIVLPETVIPILQDQAADELWQQWQDLANETQATVLLGAPLRFYNGSSTYISNSAVALTPGASTVNLEQSWRYDKHHLVPFGEFIPGLFQWFVQALNIPLGEFNRGAAQQSPVNIAGQSFAVDICYEDTFGAEIAHTINTDNPANILVNISNLAWFGNTWALEQHLWMARLRAIETARPIIRATNTGMTAVIDPNGEIRGILKPASPGVLDAEIIGTTGLTPYVKYQDKPILIISILILLIGWRYRKNRI